MSALNSNHWNVISAGLLLYMQDWGYLGNTKPRALIIECRDVIIQNLITSLQRYLLC